MRISDWSSDVCSSDLFGGDPLVAGEPPVEWGIALDVEEPQSVGADRALNVIAAHAHHPGDLIIIDFGTATTFDVVDYSGAYKGGIIAPGINLSLDALAIGRASCREGVCHDVEHSVGVWSLNKKIETRVG